MPVIYIYAINTTGGKDPKLYESPIYRKPGRKEVITHTSTRTHMRTHAHKHTHTKKSIFPIPKVRINLNLLSAGELHWFNRL